MEKRKLIGLVDTSLNEVVEHLLQNRVNSVHMKNVRKYLLEIKHVLETSPERSQLSSGLTQWGANTRASKRGFRDGASKEAAVTVAFAMSKFDYVLFNNLYLLSLNQGEVFEMAGALLGVKPTTLRNYRDTFDSHVDAVRGRQRKGWRKPLPRNFEVVKKHLDSFSEEEIMNHIAGLFSKLHRDSELVIKIAYGFLFGPREVKSTSDITIDGKTYELINAPYPKGIAYMVFTNFGNSLFKGIYPAIYVYRDFGKIFTVFGESVTHASERSWQLPLDKYLKIEDCFSDSALELIKAYPHTYLANRILEEFVLDENALSYGEYKIEIAEKIVESLRELFSYYSESFPNDF